MYNKYLAPVELTVSQYSIISFLRYSDSVSVSALAGALSLDRTTLVRNLKVLEKKELVYDNAVKGRSRQLALSDKGVHRYETARPLWENAQRDLEGAIGAENLDVMKTVLMRLSELG
jgi:DNA-binding MarR family transcriptional regulator